MDNSEKKTLNHIILGLSVLILAMLLSSLYLGRAEHKVALTFAHSAVSLASSSLGLFACSKLKRRDTRQFIAFTVAAVPSELFYLFVLNPAVLRPDFLIGAPMIVLGDILSHRFRGHAII